MYHGLRALNHEGKGTSVTKFELPYIIESESPTLNTYTYKIQYNSVYMKELSGDYQYCHLYEKQHILINSD